MTVMLPESNVESRAEAESKRLQGQGIGDYEEIARGLRICRRT